MKKFGYDPLSEPVNNSNSGATKSGKVSLGIDDDQIFTELKEKLGAEKINDKNAELFFSPAQASSSLFFSRGKVLYRSYSHYDIPGISLSVIGFFLVAAQFHREATFNLTTFFIGLICSGIGVVLTKFIRSYAVLDYSCDSIYTEVHVGSASIYKSRGINRKQIIEIGVDHQEKSATLANMDSFATLEANIRTNKPALAISDSAIVLLLNNGKTYYFNSFSGAPTAEAYFNIIAKCISFAWNIPFKRTTNKEKLVAKKIGNKWLFSKEPYAPKDAASILTSISNIIIGVGIILASIIIMFYLIYKFV